MAALLLLLQKKENAILLHTLRVIKPTRGVLKRIVIHKIRILCGLLLLMHLFAFLFNKIAHLGTMRYVSCVYLGIYYTSMYLTFFSPWSLEFTNGSCCLNKTNFYPGNFLKWYSTNFSWEAKIWSIWFHA